MVCIGNFDLDCPVDKYGGTILLEVSVRNTRIIHIHDIASHVICLDYVDKVALLSYKTMKAGSINDVTELMFAYKDFLYQMGGDLPVGS